MQTNFAFLCDAASQGAEGKLNALGIGISQIRALQVPAQHPRLVLVAEIAYSAAEAGPKPFSLRVIDADGGNVIAPVNGEVAFASPDETLTPVAHMVLELNMLTFPAYGIYAVDLRVDDEAVASMPLEVMPSA
jgi:hypothetical protein